VEEFSRGRGNFFMRRNVPEMSMGKLSGVKYPGFCFGRFFGGKELIFHKENVWGIVLGGCLNSHARLQVCTCSSYDLCHPG